MNLEELSQAQQRGCGILLLRSQTAALSEREALRELVADITHRMVKANNAGYFKGCDEATKKERERQAQQPRRSLPTGHPHGVVECHLPSGATKRVLHVDEARILTPADANKLRGLRVDEIIVYPDATMPPELDDYLHAEVLAPMRVDIADRKEHPGERKMREAGSIYARDTERETDLAYLKRFAHELEARMHDLERHAHAGELPRAVPDYQSADWGLMVVKRLEALEAGKRGETAGYQEQNKRLDELERLSNMMAGVLDGTAEPEHAGIFHRLDRSTREAHDKIAATGRQLSGRIEKIEEWMRASTARLNALEIWKHDELAKSLTAITETLEKHAQYMQGVPPLTLIREEFEAKLREHRAIFDRQRERIEGLDRSLLAHARTLLDRTHCCSAPAVVASSDAMAMGSPVSSPSLDEAFEQWRSSPWAEPELNELFGNAEPELHRKLSLLMESSFRAGWAAAL